MSNQLSSLAFLLSIYLVVPIALARLLVRATWPQICIAYGILVFGLALIGAGGRTIDEQVGWMLILGMFYTIPGIPILCFILGKARVAA